MGEYERMTSSPKFEDYIALWLLRLAKLRRRRLRTTTNEDCEGFYDQFFEQKDLEAYEEDVRLKTRRETMLEWFTGHMPGEAELLDVGCGIGDVLASLPKTYRLHGMDFSQANVQLVRKRLGPRADIHQGSIYEIPFVSESMDICLALEVLEHIEDSGRGVREIARVLKPGGVLIASVPYTFYWPDYLRLIGHFRHFTRDSFTQLMHDNGLKTEHYLPNYPRWHQTYSRRYALIRAQSIVFGRLLGNRSVYSFKWPWQRQSALTKLEQKLESLRELDKRMDYPREKTSTFLVARKPG